ncbi:MAG: NADPH-dependent FMN reductase [Gammaproteobacteria bacterium]
MNIIAFAASNSQYSINASLVRYACSLMNDAHIEMLDINDYDMPVYGIDIELSSGIPQAAHDFIQKLASADALIVSFAEHNGLYTAAYKSLFDWASRVDRYVYQHKPMVMLATSPGSRGGIGVLQIAESGAPHFGGKVLASVSIPKFGENFDLESNTLINPEYVKQIEAALALLPEAVAKEAADD